MLRSPSARCLRPPNVENIQRRTIRRCPAGATCHGPCQQSFQLRQVAKLGTHVLQMMRSYLRTSPHEAFAGPPSRSSARMSSSENPSSCERRMKARIRKIHCPVHAPAVGGSWRCREHLHALVVADGLDLHTAALRQVPDRYILGSRRRDGPHGIVLDPVVATGCILLE